MRKKNKYRIGNGLGRYGRRLFVESITELYKDPVFDKVQSAPERRKRAAGTLKNKIAT